MVWPFGRKEEHSFSNPHAEPAETSELQRSLSFLLAYLAHKGKLMDEAYTMLLGSEEDQKRGLALIARQVAARRLAGSEESGGAKLELDLHSGLHVALLECEKESAPVSAVSLQSVEDDRYKGFEERRNRRRRLVRFTVLAFLAAITLDAVSSGLIVVEESRLRQARSFEVVAEMTRRQLPGYLEQKKDLEKKLIEAGIECGAGTRSDECSELRAVEGSIEKLLGSVLMRAGERRGQLLGILTASGADCAGQNLSPTCVELNELQSEIEILVAPHLSSLNLEALDDIDAQESLMRMITYFLRSFTFFFWGIVGGGFFMLRRLYEFVETRTYDPAMKGMHAVSLLIGGLAGTLVPLAIFPQLLGFADPLTVADPSLMLSASGIAVVAGFGSKLIYGLFEKILEGLQVTIGLRTSQ